MHVSWRSGCDPSIVGPDTQLFLLDCSELEVLLTNADRLELSKTHFFNRNKSIGYRNVKKA